MEGGGGRLTIKVVCGKVLTAVESVPIFERPAEDVDPAPLEVASVVVLVAAGGVGRRLEAHVQHKVRLVVPKQPELCTSYFLVYLSKVSRLLLGAGSVNGR